MYFVRRVVATLILVVLLPFSTSALAVEDIYAQTFSLFDQIISLQKQIIQLLDTTVADLKAKLSSADNELSTTKSVLSSVNSQLSESQKQLSASQSELATTKIQLKSTQDELIACRTPPPTAPKTTSCTWNGVSYPEGTTLPFAPLAGFQSASVIPASAMMVCANYCGGSYAQYKCQNGDWVRVEIIGYPYPYPIAAKPVIYLYPTQATDVTVKLKYKGQLAYTYPQYDHIIEGWRVIARPDGTLTNLADNREYSYLFWEGKEYDLKIDESRGFVVKGSETREFLQTKLAELGLIPREYNEFIVFWLPKMEHNPYNFIQFVGEEYTSSAPLTISPKPDSMLRVFMAYKPLDSFRHVTPQVIQPFVRKGFTVVEWGGTELAK